MPNYFMCRRTPPIEITLGRERQCGGKLLFQKSSLFHLHKMQRNRGKMWWIQAINHSPASNPNNFFHVQRRGKLLHVITCGSNNGYQAKVKGLPARNKAEKRFKFTAWPHCWATLKGLGPGYNRKMKTNCQKAQRGAERRNGGCGIRAALYPHGT